LVSCLEELKEQRQEIEGQIQEEMTEKNKLEKQIASLTEKLTRINGKV
jgi:predicted  nucleic acid-binding Zn-ribbon protein